MTEAISTPIEKPKSLLESIELTGQQNSALNQVLDWMSRKNTNQTFVLAGFAGTGKTTLIRLIVEALTSRVGVCAFTGKAVDVLRSKGLTQARTLHRMIYTPVVEFGQVWYVRKDNLEFDLIIVDEASMISRSLMEDLESFPDIKILYVGDQGQLEPIGDDPNLMSRADVTLTEIHRQAAGSPIIQFSHKLRNGEEFEYGQQPGLWITDSLECMSMTEFIREGGQVICGYNNTRHMVNESYRSEIGRSGTLCVGEGVVFLKNDYRNGVFNGMSGTVTDIKDETNHYFRCDVRDSLDTLFPDLKIAKVGFKSTRLDFYKYYNTLRPIYGKEIASDVTYCDYSYCLTAHKAQGSQWDKVWVWQQSCDGWNMARWAYTAATRAAKDLIYFC